MLTEQLNIKELSNGKILSLNDYREIVRKARTAQEIRLKDLAAVDGHYDLAIGLAEWQNVKREVAGFEATRRAALALQTLTNNNHENNR
jgi:Cu/Ag efflux pump CusA